MNRVKSFDDIEEQGLMEKLPEQVKLDCNIIEQNHAKIFNNFHISDASCHDVYMEACYEHASAIEKVGSEFFRTLKNALRSFICPVTCGAQHDIAHRAWTEFYRLILSAVLGGSTKSETKIKTGNLL